MGMSIDEAIEIISDIDKAYRTFSNMEYEAMQKSIDTMRKYQKIEEIYKNWCYPTYFNATDAMNKLGEVLKDGND